MLPTFAHLLIVTGLSLGVYTKHISIANESHGYSPLILWKQCPDGAQFECASFNVSLDYANPEVGNATLAVVRLKAKSQSRLGAIFTNPGGPGDRGVGFLMKGAGDFISNVTLGQYDIVSWDPQGVNNSRPLISCGFTTPECLGQFFASTIFLDGVEACGNFTNPDDLAVYFDQVNAMDTIIRKTGQTCLDSDGAFLKYMGTAAAVRDMVSLSDAINGVGSPVNYWGFSYGTHIGNIFVNMFPKRVGKIMVDGVVDSVLWATEPSFHYIGNLLHDTDSVLVGLASECAAAGPQNCTLAQANSTTESILYGIEDLIDTADDLHKQGLTVISAYTIRKTLFGLLYSPPLWNTAVVPALESLAAIFANVTSNSMGNIPIPGNPIGLPPRSLPKWQGSPVRPRQALNGSDSPVIDPTVQNIMVLLGIACVDSIDQEEVTTEEIFQDVVRVTHEISPIFREAAATISQVFCHRFPVRAVERFTGPFNHTLAHPIIVLGNTADPATPKMNAQKIAGLLGRSARFVEQVGFGHTSLGENSDCTQTILRKYFSQGELPINGTICP